MTIDIKFAHRKDAMGKEITALLFWQYCEINNIYRGRERGTKTKVTSQVQVMFLWGQKEICSLVLEQQT